MEIITLQEYTDQYVSLYEGEIRNLPNDLALRLINKGVAAQHDKDILNSTTSDDNGKILTVVNGKPAFIEKTSELPKVTASDNGDVLKVVGGKWAKAEGGGGLLRITYEEGGTPMSSVLTSTWNEIKTAFDNGYLPYIYESNGAVNLLLYIYSEENSYCVSFVDGITYETTTPDGYPSVGD